jgi:hypothetical protein
MGCSSVVPGVGDTIIEDSRLPTPPPSPPEVRSTRTYRTQPTRYQERPTSGGSKPSVLRRASLEEDVREPGALYIDYPRAKPIVRSQSPDAVSDLEIPVNPLRK